MSDFQAAVHRLWARFTGFAVEINTERATYLRTRALIPINDRLLNRLRQARRISKPDVQRQTRESAYLRRLRQAAQDDLIGSDYHGPIG